MSEYSQILNSRIMINLLFKTTLENIGISYVVAKKNHKRLLSPPSLSLVRYVEPLPSYRPQSDCPVLRALFEMHPMRPSIGQEVQLAPCNYPLVDHKSQSGGGEGGCFSLQILSHNSSSAQPLLLYRRAAQLFLCALFSAWPT